MNLRKDNIGIDARFHKKPKIQLTSKQKKTIQAFMKTHGEGIVAMFAFCFIVFGIIFIFPLMPLMKGVMGIQDADMSFILGLYFLTLWICIGVALMLVAYELSAFIYSYVIECLSED